MITIHIVCSACKSTGVKFAIDDVQPPPGSLIFDVQPCATCLDREETKALKAGYKDGYSEGFDNGRAEVL